MIPWGLDHPAFTSPSPLSVRDVMRAWRSPGCNLQVMGSAFRRGHSVRCIQKASGQVPGWDIGPSLPTRETGGPLLNHGSYNKGTLGAPERLRWLSERFLLRIFRPDPALSKGGCCPPPPHSTIWFPSFTAPSTTAGWSPSCLLLFQLFLSMLSVIVCERCNLLQVNMRMKI